LEARAPAGASVGAKAPAFVVVGRALNLSSISLRRLFTTRF